MAQVIQKGVTFSGTSPGNNVTADKLNNLVDQSIILPTAITSLVESLTPVNADYTWLWDSASGTLKKVSMQNLVPVSFGGSNFRGLTVVNNAGALTTKLDVAASEIVMMNGAGKPRRVTSFSQTLDTGLFVTPASANGRDYSTLSGQSWGYIWAISDGTNDRTLWSSSPTTPTYPTGYSYSCLLGAWRLNNSTNIVEGFQVGRRTGMHMNWQANATPASTNDVPSISGTEFTAIQINNTPKLFTAISLAKCIPPNIVESVSGIVGPISGSANAYFAVCSQNPSANMDATTMLLNGGMVSGTGMPVTAGAGAHTYGFFGCFNFTVPVQTSQTIYLASNDNSSIYSMRITGFTLNI